jgi:hypothetical protein
MPELEEGKRKRNWTSTGSTASGCWGCVDDYRGEVKNRQSARTSFRRWPAWKSQKAAVTRFANLTLPIFYIPDRIFSIDPAEFLKVSCTEKYPLYPRLSGMSKGRIDTPVDGTEARGVPT